MYDLVSGSFIGSGLNGWGAYHDNAALNHKQTITDLVFTLSEDQTLQSQTDAKTHPGQPFSTYLRSLFIRCAGGLCGIFDKVVVDDVALFVVLVAHGAAHNIN